MYTMSLGSAQMLIPAAGLDSGQESVVLLGQRCMAILRGGWQCSDGPGPTKAEPHTAEPADGVRSHRATHRG